VPIPTGWPVDWRRFGVSQTGPDRVPDSAPPGAPAGADTVSDEDLLLRLRDRDSQALELLYDRYSRLAFALALRVLGDRDQAEDGVQDAYLAVWRGASTYDPGRGPVRSWLLTIVRNRAIDRLRGRVPTADLDLLSGTLPAAGAEVWPQVARQLLR